MTTINKDSKVLINISDESVGAFVRQTLEKSFEVNLATNVEDGIRIFFNDRPHLVIIGQALAMEDGKVLAHFIRESKRSPNTQTPIIIITNDINTIKPAYTLLPHIYYLSLPFSEENLENFCHQILKDSEGELNAARKLKTKKSKKRKKTTEGSSMNESSENAPKQADSNIVKFSIGDVIITEGELEKKIYWLKKGRLKVVKNVGDSQQVIGTIVDGEIFGEMSYLDEKPRSVSVIAETEAVVTIVPHAKFARLMGETPPLIKALVQSLVYRLRHANEMVEI